MEEPKYKHDCLECNFLGRHQLAGEQDLPAEYDLYFCNGRISPTVIARYGSEGHEYLSGLEVAQALQKNGHDQDPLVEALRRAKSGGLVPAEKQAAGR